MNEIRSLLTIARRRLETTRFLGIVHGCLLTAAIVALALIAIERVGPALFVPWIWVGPTLAALTLAIAGGIWLRKRPNERFVAVEVDDRLELREKLSTALHCEKDEDSFARAAVEDAVATARDPRTRERVKRGFAIESPNRWWMSPLVLFMALALSWMGPLDLFGSDEESEDSTVKQVAQIEPIDNVIENALGDEEMHEDIESLLEELETTAIDPAAPRTDEQVRRDAIKKLSDLNRELEDIIDGEKGKTSEALEEMMGKLKTPETGPAKELADALANGDFAEASEVLKEMIEAMEAGELSPEMADALGDQLEDIAKQLEELAKQQAALEKALQEAGLDPQLAQNPAALQQAIQNADNLNEQQKQQLQQMAQGQQQAQQMCQGLGQACQQMAQAMQQGQNGEMGQAGQNAMSQLSQMEQMQQLLQQAQAAANACQGQCEGLGQGLAIQQLQQQGGGAFGQRGQGEGGKAPISPTPWGSKEEKANIKTTAGDIIARMKVDGPITVGETKKTATELLVEVSDAYEEAIEEEQIPRRYHEAQKHYFGELERQAKEAQRTEPTEPSSDDE